MTVRTAVEAFRFARSSGPFVVLEGLHALKHAARFGAEIEDIVTPDLEQAIALAAVIAPDLEKLVRARARVVERGVFEELAPDPPATGVLALARRPQVSAEAILSGGVAAPVVCLDRPIQLGNVGAAVRVAAAAGAAGVVTSGPYDPWHARAIRAAAGLHFALPVARAESLEVGDRRWVAIHPDGDPIDAEQLGGRSVLAFGNERTGLDPAVIARADHVARIPMAEGVSSLNLATSVAVVLYMWRMSMPNLEAPL